MKYLKITNTKDGIRLAKCIMGSETIDGYKIVGVDPDAQFYAFIVSDGVIPKGTHELMVPTETINCDIFTAMREGFSVIVEGYTDNGTFYKFDTVIDFISHHFDQWGNKIYCIGCNDMNGEINEFATGGPMAPEIAIDLSAIELGVLDGVTIVEVAE